MLTTKQLGVLDNLSKTRYDIHSHSKRPPSIVICQLISQLATALLALKEAREVLKEIMSLDPMCPICLLLGCHMDNCKVAKILGEGE